MIITFSTGKTITSALLLSPFSTLTKAFPVTSASSTSCLVFPRMFSLISKSFFQSFFVFVTSISIYGASPTLYVFKVFTAAFGKVLSTMMSSIVISSVITPPIVIVPSGFSHLATSSFSLKFFIILFL